MCSFSYLLHRLKNNPIDSAEQKWEKRTVGNGKQDLHDVYYLELVSESRSQSIADQARSRLCCCADLDSRSSWRSRLSKNCQIRITHLLHPQLFCPVPQVLLSVQKKLDKCLCRFRLSVVKFDNAGFNDLT